MKKKDKQLLLKDLCARLHYGVKIKTSNGDGILCSIDYVPDGAYLGVSINGAVKEYFEYQDTKPYLRPMSSMTDKEEEKLGEVIHADFLLAKEAVVKNNTRSNNSGYNKIDWLNAHHFDYRELIKKGLALVAPEGMYN